MNSTFIKITRFVRTVFKIGSAKLQDWAVSTEQATVNEIETERLSCSSDTT